MQKKLTIQDVARLAGVSKATVSRVLNNRSSVAPALRERVMRVIEEHDFVPNITAIGLAGGHTSLIGVLAPPLTWPAVPEIMRGVAAYLDETPYEMVLYSINFERDHSDVLDRILAMRMVTGLLAILPGKLSQHLMQRFRQGLPLVMIDDQIECSTVPWVGIDNRASAYALTRYLLDLGHTRIAHIMGPKHYYCAIERYQGYCQALQDAGIALDSELVLQGNFDPISGRQCAAQLFAREKNTWPDAVFVGNDQMAYGMLEIAEQQGIPIPEAMSIIGFDDNLLSAHMRPALTTMHQPFFEMGYLAVKSLLTLIDPQHHAEKGQQEYIPSMPESSLMGASPNQPFHIQLPTTLIVRASSGVSRQLANL